MGRNEDKAYLADEMERTFDDLLDKGFNVIETGGQGTGTDPENDGFPGENRKRMFKKPRDFTTATNFCIMIP